MNTRPAISPMVENSTLSVSYEFGHFSVMSMPNQPSVALCFGFEVHPEYRGQGFGHKLKGCQMETLASNGFRFAICTIKSNNMAQRKILTKAGWAPASNAFFSQATGKATEVWQCHIHPQD